LSTAIRTLRAGGRRNNGTVLVTRSAFGYAETMTRLIEAITGRGLIVFGQIDHGAAAREAGLELPAEEVVLLGNPRAGTPLMQSDPRIGVELPLRMLVWEGPDGTLLGYTDPLELAARYAVGQHRGTLEMMSGLLAALAADAAG
jgi:uncharacterized protein (DUF302 family)